MWGWKLAGADGLSLTKLAAWLPEARWIWIERDIADCFRSAKAANMMQGPADAANFAAGAAASRAAFASIAPRALNFAYASMVADPAETVRLLEAHTGASAISENVFSVRVNITGSSVYVPPVELTAEEEAALSGAYVYPYSQAA